MVKKKYKQRARVSLKSRGKTLIGQTMEGDLRLISHIITPFAHIHEYDLLFWLRKTQMNISYSKTLHG